MIKALILDVDGVIVGDQPGVNFPLPHTEIIQKFQKVHAKGIPIILCTAKFGYAIQEIVKRAHLDNPHITDGGALVIDPLNHLTIQEHNLKKELAADIASACLKAGLYIEGFGVEDYFIQKSQAGSLTDKHTLILQKEPKIVDSLADVCQSTDIIKMIAFAEDEPAKLTVEAAIKPFSNQIHTIWTMHPTLLPYKLCIITKKGVSKKQAALDILDHLNVKPEETLGVGDTESDWSFMEDCGYAATLANGDGSIKELVQTKGEGKYFIAPHVNDNGVLDILKYFSLL